MLPEGVLDCVFTPVVSFGLTFVASCTLFRCPRAGEVVDTVVDVTVELGTAEAAEAGTGVMVTVLSITLGKRELVSVGRAGKAKAPPEKVTTPSIEGAIVWEVGELQARDCVGTAEGFELVLDVAETLFEVGTFVGLVMLTTADDATLTFDATVVAGEAALL